MFLYYRRILFALVLLLKYNYSYSQDINVSITPEKLSIGNNLKITVNVNNNQIRNYGPFPEIKGFRKSGISSSSSTNFINGKMSTSQSITQNYTAVEIGEFEVPNFLIQVNDKSISVKGKKIIVDENYNEPKQSPFNNFFDPFSDPIDNFFNRNNEEFYEVEADAFLSLSTDKKSVYVGEGFNTTLSFFVSENNVADMRFFELGKQLTEIVKKIKPASCWEENFNIENINSVPVTINNKRYNQYKIFEATYYPLNDKTINFPKLSLELIKYKVSKRPSFFGRNKIEDYETFSSKPLSIKVKKLPDHPSKENISVGKFKLKEKINKTELLTGEDIIYDFEITGEGNISAIKAPKINSSELEFYSPNSQQIIKRENSKVFGTKKYSFYGTVSKPGDYKFSNVFEWIYFDPQVEMYDTLKSSIVINVDGEPVLKSFRENIDGNPFLEIIKEADNTLISTKKENNIILILNIIVITLMISFVFFILKKKDE